MKRHASMSRIYRLVWSHVQDAWVAVAETANGRGKSASRGTAGQVRLMLKGVAAAVMTATGTLALAAPTGGQVVSGAGSVSQSGSITTINQTSQNLALNWQSFNVATNETVNFVQPSASSVAVNRIYDTNGSQILGHINANGEVFLINPNGILFGQGAQVNVGGLVASTLDVSNSSNGTVSFAGNGTGSVINQGKINAASGGFVALIGNIVGNAGSITAPLGTVALGAGSAATLTLNGSNLVQLKIDQSTLNNLAANGGLIQADGGHVILTAGAANSLLASVVNNTGVIRAETVQNQNGIITLLGGMTAGTVNVGGTLDASASASGNGGSIETSAAHVEVASDAHITTQAANGLTGSWLIDPNDFTIAASGGDMTGAALTTALGLNSVTILSSSGASGTAGNVNINDAVSWSAHTLTLTAANNINVNAVMAATGNASIALNTGGSGMVNMGMSAAGTTNSATGNAFTGQINFSGSGTVQVNGTTYTVINSLGTAASSNDGTLQGMVGNLSGHYVLGSNIDATSTSGWNAGSGFTPIGGGSFFSGVFDGFGHTVKNVTINDTTVGGVPEDGFFGSASGSIRNVGLVGGSVTAAGDQAQVGGLVGYFDGVSLSNSYSTATVTATGASTPEAGGLVGYAHGPITNSYATGNVSATGSASISAEVGGLVGYANTATITGSYATGNVSSNGTNDYVGGLVGHLANSAHINNSYATGNVSDTGTSALVGGLVGDNGGTITDSYATGSLSNGSVDTGGLVGWDNMGGTYSNDFFNAAVISNGLGNVANTAGHVYGMTVNQLKTQANFTSATAANGSSNPNWDFTNTWTYQSGVNNGLPVLIALSKTYPASDVNNSGVRNSDPTQPQETTPAHLESNILSNQDGISPYTLSISNTLTIYQTSIGDKQGNSGDFQGAQSNSGADGPNSGGQNLMGAGYNGTKVNLGVYVGSTATLQIQNGGIKLPSDASSNNQD